MAAKYEKVRIYEILCEIRKMFSYIRKKFVFRSRGGFTLLEMVISLGIFSVLVISAIGVTIGISNAQLRASQVQAIQDNIRFSLELITKEMRTGSSYALTSIGNGCTVPPSYQSEISFDTSLGERRTYYLDTAGKRIMRITSGSTNCADPLLGAVSFTAEDVEVERFIIRISGSETGPDDGQPRATISLKVKAKDPRLQQGSSMDLETTVIQRFRDL